MCVIFTVVLKSPFPSGLYPPLLYVCHFYYGVEESISSGLYLLLLYVCHLYCGVEESIFKWTVSATFVCVSFILLC